MSIRRRLSALERQIRPDPKPIRVVLCYTGAPANLEEAACHRRFLKNGALMEVVSLNGTGDHISEEDLDRFVAKFPIAPHRTGLVPANAEP
jgi:hypothetical protein